ncbi:hypothetical protein ACPXB3_14870 [Gordonia sp. DT219]
MNTPYSVTYDGVSYDPGEQVDAPSGVADAWLRAGWVTAATTKEGTP